MTNYMENTANWAEVTTNLGGAVVNFNNNGFKGFMKRKTVTENDKAMIEHLENMVKLMKEKAGM